MPQDITDNKVKAEFYLHSDKLDFSDVDNLMGITATSKRSKNTFIFEEFAKDYWMLFTDYEVSENINVQLEKILNKLPDKKIIRTICKKYNAECGFLIVVERGKNDILPGIYYEKEFIKFAAYIGAEIDMDFV